MKNYLIGALIGINVMLIWFLGIHLTQTETRVRSLEFEQVSMEHWKAQWNPTLVKASLVVSDVAKLLGHPSIYPGASTESTQGTTSPVTLQPSIRDIKTPLKGK